MNIRYQIYYVTGLLKRYGFRGLVFKTIERWQSPMLAYGRCYRRYLPTAEELQEQRKHVFSYCPLVSIVVPTYETPKVYLKELLDCVKAQSYSNWELCIADGSQTEGVQRIVEAYAGEDARIRYQRLTQNAGISENTNCGLHMAKGEFIALMDHDDLLTENALFEMVKKLNTSYTEEERCDAMLYSDEDKMNGEHTVYSRPHFKPDFNLEFLRHNNYFCHFLMFSSRLLEKTGGLQKEYDGAQDFDFVLRCVDAGAKVEHVPKILYHWRIHEGSTAGNSADKSYAFENGCKAIEAHLERCHEPGKAQITTNLGVYQIRYQLQGTYEVTVAAEEEKTLEQIRACYGEQFQGTGYQFQIRYLCIKSMEEVYKRSDIGAYLWYIQKGIRLNPKGALEILLGSCQQNRNGVVGAKVLTSHKKVASCGLLYDENGNLIPACGGISAEYKGYFLHSVIPQNVSAISFACVMFRREVLQKMQGLDENLQGIYQEADLCFRLQEEGYQVVVIPQVTVIQKAPLVPDDVYKEMFCEKWKQKLQLPDPYYNLNLSLQAYHTYAMRE